jgi:small nuclear ribonucleoprotein (snRNP)-like protein
MKTRKKGAIVVTFALMAMMARPQIMSAQAPPTPTRGSWDAVKAVPPGDKVVVSLRNGQTLNGLLISVSDTVLTLERRKKTTDVNRGDALRVYRVLKKSNTKGFLLGLLIGAGVGALVGQLAVGDSGEDPGSGAFVVGLLGAMIGGGAGAVISGRTRQLLIYETI